MNNWIFVLFITFVILLRIGELILSRRNESWLVKHKAVQSGSKHYPFIIAVHLLFFISLLAEYAIIKPLSFSLFFLLCYFILLGFKVWVITSLGKFWTTKIYHIPGVSLIKAGPYKFIKHPNYLIVIGEIACIPLVFHLYFTAIFLSALNSIVLYIRIIEENKVLNS